MPAVTLHECTVGQETGGRNVLRSQRPERERYAGHRAFGENKGQQSVCIDKGFQREFFVPRRQEQLILPADGCRGQESVF